MKSNQGQKRVGGVSANVLMVPIVSLVAILHVLIVLVIVMINQSSGQLSTTMQNAGKYTQEVTSLLAGSSLLSETSSNYVLLPTLETGEVNVGPLNAYAAELADDRRGDQVLERFKGYVVSRDELACMEAAAASADYMLQNQLHAIALTSAVFPLPPAGPLSAIPRVELTAEEQAMTDEEKLGLARSLVLGQEYAMNKRNVSQNVNACVDMIQAYSTGQSARLQQRIGRLRMWLWVITLSIIVILILSFALLYQQILFPLGRFVKLIPLNCTLDEDKGFHEVRMVACAYNDVHKRRDVLDSILRSAAETDALTNLPNRYRFEQFMAESGDSGYSVAVFLFDVNYLKQTNDTLGHLAGDALLRQSANCIAACFGENCFRFGGDEFAAVVKDCSTDSIQGMIDRFLSKEEEMNVSISFGYAFAGEIGATNLRALLDEADKNMYVQKQRTHRQA